MFNTRVSTRGKVQKRIGASGEAAASVLSNGCDTIVNLPSKHLHIFPYVIPAVSLCSWRESSTVDDGHCGDF